MTGETRKNSTARTPQIEVTISRYAWEYMTRMGKLIAPHETGGLLRVKQQGWKDGKLQLYVADAMTPPQEVTGATVEWEVEEEMKFLQEQGDWATKENPSPRPIWGKWHTHPKMGCFWSSTDEATLVKNGLGPGLLVNLVLDPTPQSGGVPFLVRTDSVLKLPGWEAGQKLWLEDIPTVAELESVVYDGMEERLAAAKELVRPKETAVVVGGYQGRWNGYYQGVFDDGWEPGESSGFGYWSATKGRGVPSTTKTGKAAIAPTSLNKKDAGLLSKLNELSKWDDKAGTIFNLSLQRQLVTIKRGGKTVSCNPDNRVFGAWFRAHFPKVNNVAGLLPRGSGTKTVCMSLASSLLAEAEAVLEGKKEVASGSK